MSKSQVIIVIIDIGICMIVYGASTLSSMRTFIISFGICIVMNMLITLINNWVDAR